MELLYKAYACVDMPGGRFLLPGCPLSPNMKIVRPNDKLCLELADGSRIETNALGTTTMMLSESVTERLPLGNANPGLREVIQVPGDFKPEITLGAKVFLVGSEGA